MIESSFSYLCNLCISILFDGMYIEEGILFAYCVKVKLLQEINFKI